MNIINHTHLYRKDDSGDTTQTRVLNESAIQPDATIEVE